MSKKSALLFLAFLSGSFFFHAIGQNLNVTGTVLNKITREPLVGATISVKGGSNVTLTDAKGSFSISVSKRGSVLLISYTGMETKDFTVGNETTSVVIELVESASITLTDVVEWDMAPKR